MTLAMLLDSRCVVCRRPGALLCATCHASVASGSPVRVRIEGVPVYALGHYSGVLRQLIRAAKNFRARAVLTVLRRDIRQLVPIGLDVPLVSVPPSRPGMRRRGYGIAPTLARMLGRHHPGVLRLVDSGTQRGRSMQERFKGRRFEILGTTPPRAVLVDDVITTGATVRAAVGALREAGCEVVAVIALAVVIRQPAVSIAP